MKILNVAVTAVLGAGLVFSGVTPAVSLERSNNVSSQDSVSFDKDLEKNFSADNVSSDSAVFSVDARSNTVTNVADNNAFADLLKTGANPNYKMKALKLADNSTRPVGVKTKIEINNIRYGYSRKVYVQQYVSSKKKWVSVSSKTTPKGNNNEWSVMRTTIDIPAFSTKSKGGTISYRVYFPKTSKYTSYTSSTMKVKYVNPRFYAGYKKTLYNDMKSSSMCPNIIIHTKKSLSRNAAGRAWFGQYKIEAVTGLKGKYRKRVSVHECAHIKSGVSYKNDIAKLYKDSNKLFKLKSNSSLGVEYLADCMSFAKMGKSYIPGYKKKCSSYQISKAKRVWSGKKIY